MQHDAPLISMIVAGLVLAFVFGAVANRFRIPPLVGYLLAGVVVGPYTPGFVGDAEMAHELSEIGVILLMFGVGLHFSLKDLLSVRAITIPGAAVQIAGATLMGLGLATWLGWSLAAGLIFGLALSVASTVVLLKALQDRHMLDSERGRIAVGWLIVEDIAMVLALVVIPALAELSGASSVDVHDPFVDFIERMTGAQLGLAGVLAMTVVKLAAFIGFMLVVGRRVIPFVLHFTAHTGSRELFRLAVLAIALGVAAGAAYLFGVSLALGAFFAGMILSESELSQRAAQETLPLRDAFAVLFFVAVGMLFDPSILVRDPLPILGVLFIILFGKSVLSFLIVIAFGRPVSTALTISASLAQIGEFSFILASLGVMLGILPVEGRNLILAGALLTIVLNPVMFWLAEAVRPRLEARLQRETVPAGPRVEPELGAGGGTAAEPAPETAESPAPAPVPTGLSGHTILIGYGRVGTVVAEGLLAAQSPLLVVEDAEGPADAARRAGAEVIGGNAASPRVLELANVEGARNVVIAIPNAFEAGQATEQCRHLNPGVFIVARAHSDEEEEYLLGLGANTVVLGVREIGLGMLEWVTRDHRTAAALKAADAVEAALAGARAVPPSVPPAAPGPAASSPSPVSAGTEVAPVSGLEEPALPLPASGAGLFADLEPPLALTDAEQEIEASVEDADRAAARAIEAGGPPRPRPHEPARTAAVPFNPEVPPAAPPEAEESEAPEAAPTGSDKP